MKKSFKLIIIIFVCLIFVAFIAVNVARFIGFWPSRQYITKLAISHNNVSICNYVGSTDIVMGWPAALPGDCYADFAAAKKDMSVCKKFRDMSPANLLFDDAKCYVNASANPETDYVHCADIVTDPGYLSENNQRTFCYEAFAQKTSNPAICPKKDDLCVLFRVLNKNSFSKNIDFYKNYCSNVTALQDIYMCNKYLNPSIDSNVSNWKSYAWSGHTFKYPPDWTMSEGGGGLYLEPGGLAVGDQIVVNRSNCTGEVGETCTVIDGWPIATFSKDQHVLDVFNLFVKNVGGAPNNSSAVVQENQTVNSKTYTNNELGFSFDYPSGTTAAITGYRSLHPFNSAPVAYFQISDNNQTEGYMTVNISNDAKDISNCIATNYSTAIINGVKFTSHPVGSGDVNGFTWDYKTLRNNSCFDIQITVFPSACVNSGCDNRLWTKQTQISMLNIINGYVQTFKFTR